MKDLRVLHLKASNVKKLRAVEFDPDRHVVVVAGKNASGKSALLDSILYALGGKRAMPGEPVRRGTKAAEIELDLGEFLVRRRIRASGTDSVNIETKEGTRYSSPQTMLDALLEEIGFNPRKWLGRRPKEQRDELLGLVDLGVDVDANRAERARIYQERRDLGRDLKRLQAEAASRQVPEVPADVPNVHDARERFRKLEHEAAERTRLSEAHRAGRNELEERRTRIKTIEQQLESERAKLAEREKALETTISRLKSWAVPNLDQARADVERAYEAQNALRLVNEAKAAKAELGRVQTRHEGLTGDIERLDRELEEALTAADFPVEGLSVGEDLVLYRGLPLEQAAASEQLRVAIAIAMRLQERKKGRRLRIVRILDGSLLDEDSMALVRRMAEEHDFQVWIERVEEGGAQIIIEDGRIAGEAGDETTRGSSSETVEHGPARSEVAGSSPASRSMATSGGGNAPFPTSKNALFETDPAAPSPTEDDFDLDDAAGDFRDEDAATEIDEEKKH